MGDRLPVAACLEKLFQRFEQAGRIAPFEDAIHTAPSWSARLAAIKAYYHEHEAAFGTDYTGCDPRLGGLWHYLTPIEDLLWRDIRSTWRAPVVMQYPVGPYFLDFACPHQKVAIEADGRGFHSPEMDQIRDQVLWSEYGWKVYRVTGRQCHRSSYSPADFIDRHGERWGHDEGVRMFFTWSSSGVVRAIGCLELGESKPGDYAQWMREALADHKLADFPVGRQ